MLFSANILVRWWQWCTGWWRTCSTSSCSSSSSSSHLGSAISQSSTPTRIGTGGRHQRSHTERQDSLKSQFYFWLRIYLFYSWRYRQGCEAVRFGWLCGYPHFCGSGFGSYLRIIFYRHFHLMTEIWTLTGALTMGCSCSNPKRAASAPQHCCSLI